MFQKIEAYIRPEKLNDVKNELHKIGIIGMSIIEAHGHGRQGGVTLAGRSSTYTVEWLEKTLLSVVVSGKNLEKTISGIKKATYTGEEGDGIIFVSPVSEIIRISSSERGKEAMQYPKDIDSK